MAVDSGRSYYHEFERKLREQAPAARSHVFAGCTVYINGRTTVAPRFELDKLVWENGGSVARMYRKTAVLHIVGENLSGKKTAELIRDAGRTQLIHPQWLVDCAAAQRRLPTAQYVLVTGGPDARRVDRMMAAGRAAPAVAAAAAAAAATGAAATTPAEQQPTESPAHEQASSLVSAHASELPRARDRAQALARDRDGASPPRHDPAPPRKRRRAPARGDAEAAPTGCRPRDTACPVASRLPPRWGTPFRGSRAPPVQGANVRVPPLASVHRA